MPDKNKVDIKKDLKKKVFALFEAAPSSLYNYKQIAARLGIEDFFIRKSLQTLLEELANDKKLVLLSKGKYRYNKKGMLIEGVVDMTARGTAYIVVEGEDEDIFISEKHVGKAFHGDTVKVILFPDKKKKTGEILEIVKRNKKQFVGKIQVGKKASFFICDDKRVPVDMYIDRAKLNGATDGDKVLVKVTDWPDGAKNPFGIVLEVFGRPGDNEAEMRAVLASKGLPYAFPPAIEEAANRLDLSVSTHEIAKRRDFRDVTTFTIDPKDAKDFDDALSVQTLPNGDIEVGVHIADVTHYLRPGSILDKEAYDRGTSVYLVDRVVPMLPEVLSNFACSLRPNEEKFCFSIVFVFDPKKYVITDQWIGRTVIYSDRRFTYEEAQEIIEGAEGDYMDEIHQLDVIAKHYRAKRFKKGAIAFDRSEVRFELDEKGNPLSVYFKKSQDANKLIEEFMLLANKKVAEFIGKPKGKQKPKAFVYRIHDEPNMDKIEVLSTFVRKLGYGLKSGKSASSSSINNLLKESSQKQEGDMIAQLAIRTMAKAVYSTNNIGHFGLAFDHYSHFTSPIRRYPDVMVHRLLARYLDGEGTVVQKDLEADCKHWSEREQFATEAERTSIKFKQVQYLMDKIGEVFDGVISGVSEWGVYVQLNENLCEGMVSLRSMTDDHYIYDADNYQVVGKRTKETLRMGDAVTIRIARADLEKKQLDFELIEKGF